MSQFDLSGKFWIRRDGGIIDCTTDEHARSARGLMLGVPADELHRAIHLDEIFKPLTIKQRAYWLGRGADLNAVEFLCAGNVVDPRAWALKEWTFIRQRWNDFYAWRWNDDLKLTLSESDDFWARQPKATGKTWAALYNVVDSGVESGSLSALGIRFAG